MSIQVGEKVPDVTLKWLTPEGLGEVKTGELLAGKKVVLFSVPGAYTPTCSADHLPGYVARADEIKAKGVDAIICLAINDPWVMKTWGEAQGVGDKIVMLPDGNGALTKAMGLDQDLGVAALGVRGKRFSMRINDGVVESLDIEAGKGVTVSGADVCLTGLG